LGVDLHGHRDLRVTQDMHDLAGVHIEVDQEGGAGTPAVMDGDLADSRLAAVGVPGTIGGSLIFGFSSLVVEFLIRGAVQPLHAVQ
jgi:hypothetical protein